MNITASKRRSGWCVYNRSTGHVFSCHKTQSAATRAKSKTTAEHVGVMNMGGAKRRKKR